MTKYILYGASITCSTTRTQTHTQVSQAPPVTQPACLVHVADCFGRSVSQGGG